jgi:hypothetical protein
MRQNGWGDIRKNQVQVDAKGNVAGNNRPDISGINPKTLQRVNVEIDNSAANSQRHIQTLNRNDPAARNVGTLLP